MKMRSNVVFASISIAALIQCVSSSNCMVKPKRKMIKSKLLNNTIADAFAFESESFNQPTGLTKICEVNILEDLLKKKEIQSLFASCGSVGYQIFPYAGIPPTKNQFEKICSKKDCYELFKSILSHSLPRCKIGGMVIVSCFESLKRNCDSFYKQQKVNFEEITNVFLDRSPPKPSEAPTNIPTIIPTPSQTKPIVTNPPTVSVKPTSIEMTQKPTQGPTTNSPASHTSIPTNSPVASAKPVLPKTSRIGNKDDDNDDSVDSGDNDSNESVDR